MDLSYYRNLIMQSARLDAFRRALGIVVQKGDRVLEVGTGLGTYTFFAVEAGADEVWAVDDAPVVHLAEDVARENGIGSIRWVRGRVPEVGIPGPVDVLVYEDFSPRLLDPAMWGLYRALHRHTVTEKTRFVPRRGLLRAAPASVPDLVSVPEGPGAHGIRWDALRPYLANLPRSGTAEPDALLAPGATLCTVDFGVPPSRWPLGGTAHFTAERPGQLSALAMWHVLELAPGITLDNAPGAHPGSWGHLVLPCDPPLEVARGTTITVDIRFDADAAGVPMWLSWKVTVGARCVRGHEMAGFPAAGADLVAASPDGRPGLSAEGRLLSEMLALADGTRTAAEIAGVLRLSYPDEDESDLLARVLSHAGAGLLVWKREVP